MWDGAGVPFCDLERVCGSVDTGHTIAKHHSGCPLHSQSPHCVPGCVLAAPGRSFSSVHHTWAQVTHAHLHNTQHHWQGSSKHMTGWVCWHRTGQSIDKACSLSSHTMQSGQALNQPTLDSTPKVELLATTQTLPTLIVKNNPTLPPPSSQLCQVMSLTPKDSV